MKEKIKYLIFYKITIELFEINSKNKEKFDFYSKTFRKAIAELTK